MEKYDVVIIVPDWEDSVVKAVGLSKVNEATGVAVVDAAGNLLGVYQGAGAVDAVLECLK